MELFAKQNQIIIKFKPIKKTIKLINYLYNENFYIKIVTARYMGRNNENKLLAKKNGLADKKSVK